MTLQQEQNCGVCRRYMGLRGWVLASNNILSVFKSFE